MEATAQQSVPIALGRAVLIPCKSTVAAFSTRGDGVSQRSICLTWFALVYNLARAPCHSEK